MAYFDGNCLEYGQALQLYFAKVENGWNTNMDSNPVSEVIYILHFSIILN